VWVGGGGLYLPRVCPTPSSPPRLPPPFFQHQTLGP